MKLFFIILLVVCGTSLCEARAKNLNQNEIEKEWTFMVFLNAHNNLNWYGKKDLNEMEEVGSNKQMNIVVQWASLDSEKTKRLLIQKDDNFTAVTSPIIENLERIDMGDYNKLVEFVAWVKEHYPAKHYMLDIWNHGSGWHYLNNNDHINTTDISFDDISGNAITTKQLGLAMKSIKEILGKNVDIYGSDACLMAMIEIAGELADSVDIMVGSQELEPLDGWPYHDFLKAVNKSGDYSPDNLAKSLVKVYVESYIDGSQGNDTATLSAIRLNQYQDFKNQFSLLSQRLKNISDETFVSLRVNLKENVQRFDYRDYADFTDMIDVLSKNISDSSINFRAINELVSSMIIVNATTSNMEEAMGISIWLPYYKSTLASYSELYSQLDIASTAWLDVLGRIVE